MRTSIKLKYDNYLSNALELDIIHAIQQRFLRSLRDFGRHRHRQRPKYAGTDRHKTAHTGTYRHKTTQTGTWPFAFGTR